jgi:hypothetical protein
VLNIFNGLVAKAKLSLGDFEAPVWRSWSKLTIAKIIANTTETDWCSLALQIQLLWEASQCKTNYIQFKKVAAYIV